MNLDSEKDALLRISLQQIVNIKVEAILYNGDHLGYWAVFDDSIISCSISSIYSGIQEFYKTIDSSDNRRELASYNSRILTRLASSEVVSLAAENTFRSLIDMIDSFNPLEVSYDVYYKGELRHFSLYDKIFILMYIYQDAIDLSYLTAQDEYLTSASRIKLNKSRTK